MQRWLYAYPMTLLAMFTLFCSSITSPLSAPICLLPGKQKRLNDRRAKSCGPSKEAPPPSERAVDSEVVQGVCSRREAAIAAQQLAAHPSSPVVNVLSSSSHASSSLIRSVLCLLIHTAYICGVCSTCHPSPPFHVIRLCIKRLCAKPRPLEQLRSSTAHRHSVLKETLAATSGINPLTLCRFTCGILTASQLAVSK